MPFSHSSQISTIIGEAEALRPSSVLDVGTGMGLYGLLLRTNLENINLFDIEGPVARQAPRERWQVRIEGIEGFAEYLTPVHQYAYDKVHIGDALDLLPRLPAAAFDLVLAIDILEHFHEPDGVRFLDHCKRVAKKRVLVSTPKEFMHQEVEANPLEDHRSVWTREGLAKCGFSRVLANDISWIAIHDK